MLSKVKNRRVKHMFGLWGVFIITLKVDCMHIARLLKQFQNVTAQNLSIVFTKFCAHEMHNARRKLCRACGLRQRRDFTSEAIEYGVPFVK